MTTLVTAIKKLKWEGGSTITDEKTIALVLKAFKIQAEADIIDRANINQEPLRKLLTILA